MKTFIFTAVMFSLIGLLYTRTRTTYNLPLMCCQYGFLSFLVTFSSGSLVRFRLAGKKNIGIVKKNIGMPVMMKPNHQAPIKRGSSGASKVAVNNIN